MFTRNKKSNKKRKGKRHPVSRGCGQVRDKPSSVSIPKSLNSLTSSRTVSLKCTLVANGIFVLVILMILHFLELKSIRFRRPQVYLNHFWKGYDHHHSLLLWTSNLLSSACKAIALVEQTTLGKSLINRSKNIVPQGYSPAVQQRWFLSKKVNNHQWLLFFFDY